jgi:hypothetical protein
MKRRTDMRFVRKRSEFEFSVDEVNNIDFYILQISELNSPVIVIRTYSLNTECIFVRCLTIEPYGTVRQWLRDGVVNLGFSVDPYIIESCDPTKVESITYLEDMAISLFNNKEEDKK